MKNQIAIRTYDLESNHETIENHLFSYFKKHKKRYVRDKIIGKKIYQHIITDTEKQFEKSSL
ncbi:MAG: hypothetical protein Q4B43_00035 [Bacteroidota bacterium]|nr:hypothetical protein [Bacteroidota bacterium]